MPFGVRAGSYRKTARDATLVGIRQLTGSGGDDSFNGTVEFSYNPAPQASKHLRMLSLWPSSRPTGLQSRVAGRKAGLKAA